MSAGIGLFLAFIGLQGGQGIGVVSDDEATLVTLGEEPQPYLCHYCLLAIRRGLQALGWLWLPNYFSMEFSPRCLSPLCSHVGRER